MSNELLQTVAAITTLVVIVIGVTVAIVELRQEVLARRLQGVSALFSQVWPEEVSRAAFSLFTALNPDFDDADVSPDQRREMILLMAHYNRLGFLLKQGLVKEDEILGYPPFGILAAEQWAMYGGYLRRLEAPSLKTNFGDQAIWWEYLALQAEAYWNRKGHTAAASVPFYKTAPSTYLDDWNVAMGQRAAAS